MWVCVVYGHRYSSEQVEVIEREGGEENERGLEDSRTPTHHNHLLHRNHTEHFVNTTRYFPHTACTIMAQAMVINTAPERGECGSYCTTQQRQLIASRFVFFRRVWAKGTEYVGGLERNMGPGDLDCQSVAHRIAPLIVPPSIHPPTVANITAAKTVAGEFSAQTPCPSRVTVRDGQSLTGRGQSAIVPACCTQTSSGRVSVHERCSR